MFDRSIPYDLFDLQSRPTPGHRGRTARVRVGPCVQNEVGRRASEQANEWYVFVPHHGFMCGTHDEYICHLAHHDQRIDDQEYEHQHCGMALQAVRIPIDHPSARANRKIPTAPITSAIGEIMV